MPVPLRHSTLWPKSKLTVKHHKPGKMLVPTASHHPASKTLSSIVTQSSGRGSAGLVGSCVTDEQSHDRASSGVVPQRPARRDPTRRPRVYISGGVGSAIFSRRPSFSTEATSIKSGSDRQRVGPGPHDGELVWTIRPTDRHVVPGGHERQFSPRHDRPSTRRLTAVYVKVNARLSQRDISSLSPLSVS